MNIVPPHWDLDAAETLKAELESRLARATDGQGASGGNAAPPLYDTLAAIAAFGHPVGTEVLEQIARDPSRAAKVRAKAAEALMLDGTGSHDELIASLVVSGDAMLAGNLAGSVAAHEYRGVMPRLIEGLNRSPDDQQEPANRVAIVRALSGFNLYERRNTAFVAALQDVARNGVDAASVLALQTIGNACDTEPIQEVRRTVHDALKDPTHTDRFVVAADMLLRLAAPLQDTNPLLVEWFGPPGRPDDALSTDEYEEVLTGLRNAIEQAKVLPDDPDAQIAAARSIRCLSAFDAIRPDEVRSFVTSDNAAISIAAIEIVCARFTRSDRDEPTPEDRAVLQDVAASLAEHWQPAQDLPVHEQDPLERALAEMPLAFRSALAGPLGQAFEESMASIERLRGHVQLRPPPAGLALEDHRLETIAGDAFDPATSDAGPREALRAELAQLPPLVTALGALGQHNRLPISDVVTGVALGKDIHRPLTRAVAQWQWGDNMDDEAYVVPAMQSLRALIKHRRMEEYGPDISQALSSAERAIEEHGHGSTPGLPITELRNVARDGLAFDIGSDLRSLSTSEVEGHTAHCLGALDENAASTMGRLAARALKELKTRHDRTYDAIVEACSKNPIAAKLVVPYVADDGSYEALLHLATSEDVPLEVRAAACGRSAKDAIRQAYRPMSFDDGHFGASRPDATEVVFGPEAVVGTVIEQSSTRTVGLRPDRVEEHLPPPVSLPDERSVGEPLTGAVEPDDIDPYWLTDEGRLLAELLLSPEGTPDEQNATQEANWGLDELDRHDGIEYGGSRRSLDFDAMSQFDTDLGNPGPDRHIENTGHEPPDFDLDF